MREYKEIRIEGMVYTKAKRQVLSERMRIILQTWFSQRK